MDPLSEQVCRLCFTDGLPLLNIYDAGEAQMHDMLAKHIGEANKTDMLPKFICTMCSNTVTEFHDFCCDVQQAQQHFLSSLVKNEHDSSGGQDFDSQKTIDCEPCSSGYPSALMTFNAELSDSNIGPEPDVEDACSMQGMIDFMKIQDPIEITTSTKENIARNVEINERKAVRQLEKIARYDKLKETGASRKHRRYEPLDEATMIAEIEKHFDRTCDMCPTKLTLLYGAIQHYRDKHHTAGYLKCCGYKLPKETLVEDHIRLHRNPKVFQCSYCDRILKTRKTLSNHQGKHNSKNRLICDICGSVFFEYKRLQSHMNRHVKQLLDATRCQFCSKSFEAPKLKQHLNEVHIEELDKQLGKLMALIETDVDTQRLLIEYCDMKCDHCDGHFTSIEEAQCHYLSLHNIPKGYIKCCGQQYSDIESAHGHLLFHLTPILLQCILCSTRLTSLNAFKEHAKCHNQDIFNKYAMEPTTEKSSQVPQKLPCNQCELKFASESLRSSHIQCVHTISGINANEPVTCQYCTQEFLTHTLLQTHTIKMHPEHSDGDKLQCNICKKWLSNQGILRAHMERHFSGPQHCPHCDRISPNKDALKQHIKFMHQMKRSLLCHLCGKAFKESASLKDHVATHTGEKSYKCTFCPKEFVWRPNMSKHVRTVHSNEWNAERKKNGKDLTRRPKPLSR